MQRLQFFRSEAAWDVDPVTQQRIALLLSGPLTAPHSACVLVLDDTGDRKDGTATDHVARQYLGSVGKIDNGIVAVTSIWADARVYYPLHVAPCTPAGRLEGGTQDPGFRTKPQIALALVERARVARPVVMAHALLARVDDHALTAGPRGTPRRRLRGARH